MFGKGVCRDEVGLDPPNLPRQLRVIRARDRRLGKKSSRSKFWHEQADFALVSGCQHRLECRAEKTLKSLSQGNFIRFANGG